MPIMLDDVSFGGYPTEYLLSRIRSRRSALRQANGMEKEKHWPSGEDDGQVWQAGQKERRWLFGQMNPELRSILGPVFVYFEINTLVQVVRSLVSSQPDRIFSLLQQSLLRKEIKEIFSSRKNIAEVLAGFERYCRGKHVGIDGLVGAYEEGGLRKSEEIFRSRFLSRALCVSRHSSVTMFVKDLVGMRNLLVLAMWRRWQITSRPFLVTGRDMDMKLSGEGVAENDLRRMIRRWSGGPELRADQLDPVVLEPILQSRLLRKMTRLRRLGDPVAECIEFIWQIFLITRKRSIRYHGGRVSEGNDRYGGP